MVQVADSQYASPRQGGRADKLLEHPRFRAAYDFLLLREQAGEELQELGSWWTQYQNASLEEREQLRQNLQKNESGVTRNNRRRRNNRSRSANKPTAH